MVILGDQHLLESVYLNKYSMSTKPESGSSPLYLSDLTEMLIVKNSNESYSYLAIVNNKIAFQ